jgi:alpha/beta superfamily hydrolase
MGVETVYLETIDGVSIEADLIRTSHTPVRATVIIGHPHPLYGGDRFNHVVQAMQRAAADAQCHSIALDFRGVGNSGGQFDDGDSERLDLAAACELVDLIEIDCPIIMVGYSFGSAVALNVNNPWIAGWIGIAPPIAMLTSTPLSAMNTRPKILVVPEHDQYSTPAALREFTSSWTNTSVTELAQVDHAIAVGAQEACSQALEKILSTIS